MATAIRAVVLCLVVAGCFLGTSVSTAGDKRAADEPPELVERYRDWLQEVEQLLGDEEAGRDPPGERRVHPLAGAATGHRGTADRETAQRALTLDRDNPEDVEALALAVASLESQTLGAGAPDRSDPQARIRIPQTRIRISLDGQVHLPSGRRRLLRHGISKR